MIKALLGLAAAVVVAVLAAGVWYRVEAESDQAPTPAPWAQNRMEFVAWDDEAWTAWIHGDRFELAPRHEGKWRRHANPTIAFTDWQGEPWQAKIEGEQFLLARRGDWKGRTERASAVRYRDWRGDPQLRTVAQLRR
jgi:hypothetical protein